MDNYSNDQEMSSRIANLNDNGNTGTTPDNPNYISPDQMQQINLLQQQLYQQQMQQLQMQQMQQLQPPPQPQPLHQNDYKQKFIESLPELLKEPSIVAILFIIFSFPSIRDQFSKYIPQIKPNPDGSLSIAGLLGMGIIVGILFVFLKKFLVKE